MILLSLSISMLASFVFCSGNILDLRWDIEISIDERESAFVILVELINM